MTWGEVLAWEPPGRFAMSWKMTPVPTEVELTFQALGPALTRVSVEHRGWEALSDEPRTVRCPADTPMAPTSGAGRRSWPG